jgi:threonine/homoserine/homoserine lactone efflux protein
MSGVISEQIVEVLSVLVPVFAVFIPALILPGPDFVGVVRSSLTRGTTAGLLTTLGVTIGLGFYAALSLLGLSAILVEYQWLTWAVRVLGGLYLAWLGIKLLRAKPAQPGEELAGSSGEMRGSPLLFGFIVTLTNPKAIVLFASVFATSVTASTPFWLMALTVGLVMLSSLVWYTIVSLFMSSAPVMRRFQHARHWIERIAGASFVLIGGKIIVDARTPVSP